MTKIKIGIVEDEQMEALRICETLEDLGYEYTTPVADYAAALKMIEEEKPDLLLLDIVINGKSDGIDIAWKIKEEYQLPFIFLTGNADAITIERAKQTEPTAYLVKPFGSESLFSAIEICLHNHKTQTAKKADGTANETLYIKDGTHFHKIKFSDIHYLESDHVYVVVHTKGKKNIGTNNHARIFTQF